MEHGYGRLGVLDDYCFSSLLGSMPGSMPDQAAVPTWLSPALDLPSFVLEAPLAPVDRTSTAVLKRSAETAASGWSSCPVVCRTGTSVDTHVDVTPTRRQTLPARRRATSGGASAIGPAESRPLLGRSHPRGMTTNAESNSKLSRPGNGRAGPVIYSLPVFPPLA